MAEESKNEAPATAAPAAPAAQSIGVRLLPAADSDLPILSNFTRVQASPPAVIVDFGFLEPATLNSLAGGVRSGGKMPASIDGRLAARFALTPDALMALHQQLGQAIAGLRDVQKRKEASKA